MQRISSRSIHQDTPSGETIYVGSPQSQTLLRVYDKLLESQAKQREDWQDYGIRFDLARLLLATENMEPAIRIERTTCGLRRLEPDDCSAAESPPQSSKPDDKPRG